MKKNRVERLEVTWSQVVEGKHPFLLTVTQAPLALPQALLAREDVTVIELIPENREALPDQILARLAP